MVKNLFNCRNTFILDGTSDEFWVSAPPRGPKRTPAESIVSSSSWYLVDYIVRYRYTESSQLHPRPQTDTSGECIVSSSSWYLVDYILRYRYTESSQPHPRPQADTSGEYIVCSWDLVDYIVRDRDTEYGTRLPKGKRGKMPPSYVVCQRTLWLTLIMLISLI